MFINHEFSFPYADPMLASGRAAQGKGLYYHTISYPINLVPLLFVPFFSGQYKVHIAVPGVCPRV